MAYIVILNLYSTKENLWLERKTPSITQWYEDFTVLPTFDMYFIVAIFIWILFGFIWTANISLCIQPMHVLFSLMLQELNFSFFLCSSPSLFSYMSFQKNDKILMCLPDRKMFMLSIYWLNKRTSMSISQLTAIICGKEEAASCSLWPQDGMPLLVPWVGWLVSPSLPREGHWTGRLPDLRWVLGPIILPRNRKELQEQAVLEAP